MYRKSLHKRLLHHKQKLLDIDHMKKNFMAQEMSNSSTLLKHQGKQFWKELTQFASKVNYKHFFYHVNYNGKATESLIIILGNKWFESENAF
jgi:hypothetical protein